MGAGAGTPELTCSFMTNCLVYMPCYDPAVDTWESCVDCALSLRELTPQSAETFSIRDHHHHHGRCKGRGCRE